MRLEEAYEQERMNLVKEIADLTREVKNLDKIIELNLKDLWDIADQRDWYYYEYQKLKSQSQSKNINK
jgi:hypothetical protein